MPENIQERITSLVDAFAGKLPTTRQLPADAENFIIDLRSAVSEAAVSECEAEDDTRKLFEALVDALSYVVDHSEICTLEDAQGFSKMNPELFQRLIAMDEIGDFFASFCDDIQRKMKKLEEVNQDKCEAAVEEAARATTQEIRDYLRAILDGPDYKLRAKLTAYIQGLEDRKPPMDMDVLVTTAQ